MAKRYTRVEAAIDSERGVFMISVAAELAGRSVADAAPVIRSLNPPSSFGGQNAGFIVFADEKRPAKALGSWADVWSRIDKRTQTVAGCADYPTGRR